MENNECKVARKVPRHRKGLCALLDLPQALLKVLPIVHDDLAFAVILQNLRHLLHLLFTILDSVDANVANARDVGSHGGRSTTFTIFYSNTLFILDSKLFTSKVVDLRIGLAGRGDQAGSRAVDVLVPEVFHEVGLFERSDDARLSARADDRHGVAHLLDLLELFGNVRARLRFCHELRNHLTQLGLDILLQLLRGHGEAVQLLQAQHHAAEVLPDELFEEAFSGVGCGDVMFPEKFVG